MAERGRYKTKHHDSVMEILSESPARCFTVDELCELLNKEGRRIGRTTVYRQLERMAAEGEAMKYISEKGESASYRFGGGGCRLHLHLKCLDCGGLIHLDCSVAEDFSAHLSEHHAFLLDPSKTVIYGHCGCSGESAKKR
ncbi:MAG: transcriptional repressor [Synergistaceae bacterium]|nr:transcriptional repressor [Synergistaceae bacterium]